MPEKSELRPMLFFEAPGLNRVFNSFVLRIPGTEDKPLEERYHKMAVCFGPGVRNVMDMIDLKLEDAHYFAAPGETLGEFVDRILTDLAGIRWPRNGIFIFESIGFWEWNADRNKVQLR